MSSPSSQRVSLGPHEEPPRVPFLDGIRGIAVLLVLLHHGNKVDLNSRFDSFLMMLTQSSWMGVDLFFVLSGFLITGILMDTKRSGNFFRNFYARRAVRIFPIYFFTLFLYFYVYHPIFRPQDPDILDLKGKQLWYWTYLSNVYVAMHGTWPRAGHLWHLWSVSIEEQFYLLWPAVVLLASRERLKFICLCCIVCSLLLRTLLVMSYAGPVPVYVSSATRLEGLALGALISAMIREPDEIALLVRNLRIAGMAGLAVVLACFAFRGGMNMTAVFDDDVPLTLYSKFVLTGGLFAVALMFAWLVVEALIASPTGWLTRLLSAKVCRLFGKYSYCIYLWHAPLVIFMTDHWGISPRNFPRFFGSQIIGQAVFYAILIALSLILAMLSWELFEKQCLKLKRFFPYGTLVEPGKTAVPSPASSLENRRVAVAPAGKS